ncbi:alpha-related fimbriae major subunit [Yersinia intermedia]|uniref:Alpha-related fimbriae major subunit n=1 Tax=Yersinia intermedia TaxID=631 RepID=A0A0H5LYC8_YERIN|nr:hypothetical protein [Yersinia intermedia]CRY56025.1 alpha-related fimbriae major subunit [Yersinia intermedia]
MKVKNKYLFIGLILSIVAPTAMAEPYFYNNYVKSYSNCSIKVLDDNSVDISFRVNLADNLFNLQKAGKHLRQWQELIKSERIIPLSRNNALLSLYFYNTDGSPVLNTQFGDIRDLKINGVSPEKSNNTLKQIIFHSGSAAFNQPYYSVSFNVAANVLKSIRVGATVGGILIASSTKQEYFLLSSKGVSFNSLGNQCESFDPQLGIAPPTLSVDPKFRLTSETWQLKTVDLDHLLDSIANGQSFHAPLVNPIVSRFCLHYRSMGVSGYRYMIKASNLNGLAGNNQYFQLKEKEGHHTIHYKVRMKNADNTEANFELPKDQKFIRLDKNSDMEQMCWSPRMRLYPTDTSTNIGHYSDTLNFTITPEA